MSMPVPLSWRRSTVVTGLRIGLKTGQYTGLKTGLKASLAGGLILTAGLISTEGASAQTTPPADVTLPPRAPEAVEQTIPTTPPPISVPDPEPPAIDLEIPTLPEPEPLAPTALRFRVNRVEVLGNTVLHDEIRAIASQLENRNVTFADLLQLRADITQLYISNGFITSGAFLPNNQDLTNGIVQVQVLEGTLEEIEIVGLQRLREQYVRSRVQLGTGTPLNQARLEDALRLLQLDPLLQTVDAELIAGTGAGQNILMLALTEAPAFSTTLSTDNYRSPSVGTTQGTLQVAHNNVLGGGNRAEASLSLSEGLTLYDLAYTVPITPQGGTVIFSYDNSNSQIIEDDFRDLDIRSRTETVSVGVRQPIVRSAQNEVGLGLAVDLRRNRTSLLGRPFSFSEGPEEGASNITAVRFSQDWVRRDTRRVLSGRSQFSLGIDAFDATVNDTGTDGTFFSWLGQFQWVERAAPRVLLVSQVNTQLTPDSLLPLERFSLGGLGSVRGYEANQIVADNGVTASVEALISLTDNPNELLVTPFVEAGTAWDTKGERLEDATLASVGVGMRWAATPNLQLRANYGIPLIDVAGRGNSLQSSGITFSVVYEPTR
ncbi:MAG: ShlB/FhaC/HecB family hemolysin secretion/activation protein [Cyanobacteria bacterium J06597_16]